MWRYLNILFACGALSACNGGVVHQISEGSVEACSNPAVRREFISRQNKLDGAADPDEARIYNEDLSRLKSDLSDIRVLSFDQNTKTLTCHVTVTEHLNGKQDAYETLFSLQQDGDHLSSFILGGLGGSSSTSPLIDKDIPAKLIRLHNANPGAYPNLKPIPACPEASPGDLYYHPGPCGPIDSYDAGDPTFDHSKGDRRPPTPLHKCKYVEGDQRRSQTRDPACLSSSGAPSSPSALLDNADVISTADGSTPPRALVTAWGQNEESCRGSENPEAPATQAACSVRDNAYAQLNKLGWCHGREDEVEAAFRWQRCAPGTNGYKDSPEGKGRP